MHSNLSLILQSPALLIIDLQRYFIDPEGKAYLAPPKKLVSNIIQLIEVFKRYKRPIFFTRHGHHLGQPGKAMNCHWEGDLLYEEDPQAELIQDLLPYVTKESLIKKDRYSALAGTTLEKLLIKNKTEELVLSGVLTNLCVETTARHAFLKDYFPIVVRDACAAQSLKHHQAALLNLSYGFGPVVTTKQLLKSLKKLP